MGPGGNDIYLQLVGDGDPHTLVRPDTIRPSTATELLEQILARDETPRSARTVLRDQQDLAVQLGQTVERYLDALHMAAENASVSRQRTHWNPLQTNWCPGYRTSRHGRHYVPICFFSP